MTDLLAAGVAGLLAAQVMEVPAYLQKQAGLGVRQDIFAETGAILRVPKRWQRVAGWFGHAVTAVVVAMLYRVLFEAVQADAHLVAWGIVGGVVHFGVGGLVVGALPLLHPGMPNDVPAPGVFYWRYGRLDVVTFLGGHVVFGALVGLLYEALKRQA